MPEEKQTNQRFFITLAIKMRTRSRSVGHDYHREHIGFPVRRARTPTERMVFHEDRVSIWGWPSRGGLIVLDNTTAVDIEFLGLDPVKPRLRRDSDQDAEDRFCQLILRLGAKWFDSRDRFGFVGGVMEDDDRMISDLEEGNAEKLTLMERRWVCVGISSGGGFWIAEYDTPTYGVMEKNNLGPDDKARVMLARSMAERCEILKAMQAKFYESEDQYEGAACLKAWKEKTTGEVGPLVQTKYRDE